MSADLRAMPQAARATHASHRARILGLGLSVGIAIAVAGCKTDGRPPVETLKAKQHEQNALAGYMVRLGYARWATACGFRAGQKGKPLSEALSKCAVDFHFTGPITGEP